MHFLKRKGHCKATWALFKAHFPFSCFMLYKNYRNYCPAITSNSYHHHASFLLPFVSDTTTLIFFHSAFPPCLIVPIINTLCSKSIISGCHLKLFLPPHKVSVFSTSSFLFLSLFQINPVTLKTSHHHYHTTHKLNRWTNLVKSKGSKVQK